jgi:hypothetical protein
MQAGRSESLDFGTKRASLLCTEAAARDAARTKGRGAIVQTDSGLIWPDDGLSRQHLNAQMGGNERTGESEIRFGPREPASLFRFSWKWRRRSSSKVKERTPEEATKAIRARREGRHPEAAFAGEGAHIEVMRWSGTSADGLLPLAEGILRERGCCLRAESANQPLR